MSHGYLLNAIGCENTRRVVKAALAGGWEWVGITKGSHLEIRWPATGELLHTGCTPGPNSWKRFAADIKRISGVETWSKGNRKRSRKNPTAPDPQVEAARAKHARRLAADGKRRREARDAIERQHLGALRAAAEEQARNEIEQLMQPGRG